MAVKAKKAVYMSLSNDNKTVKMSSGGESITFPADAIDGVRTCLYYLRAVSSEFGIDPDPGRYSEPATLEKRPPTKKPKETPQTTAKKYTSVPYTALVRLYNEMCPSLPQMAEPSAWHKKTRRARKTTIARLWHLEPSFHSWKLLFYRVEASNHLTGRTGERKPVNFDWILKQGNIRKIREGRYDNVKRLDEYGRPPVIGEFLKKYGYSQPR